MRCHIECFRVYDEELLIADNRDNPPQEPVTLIMYKNPQQRIAIFGANDDTFVHNFHPPEVTTIMQGSWDEVYPVFELYRDML